MKLNRFFSFLLLLFSLSIGTVVAELNVVWVRTGVVLEAETKEEFDTKVEVATEQNPSSFKAMSLQRIDDKRRLLNFSWRPNTSYRFRVGADITEETSPQKPVPYLIRTVELDGVLSLMENLRQPAEPTSIAFGYSDDTPKLAVATDKGHIAIIQPMTGKTIWKTRISEGYVRHVAFSHDNSLLYVGEQAADGFIYCYELIGAKPNLRWKYRTADEIETSTPTNPDSIYAWVSYPGQSCMRTLPNGDLLVAGVHSWTQNDTPQKRSLLYRFDAKTGDVVWQFPREGTTQKIYRWFDVDTDGKMLALVADESGKGNGALSVIDVESGIEKWSKEIEPLKPYFEGITFWRGVSMSPDGKFVNVTTDDGRAFIFDVNSPEPIWTQNLATPIEVSDVPIIATTGTIGATNAGALFVTGDTYIPYHLQKGAQRPSTLHPNGMTLFAYSWHGEKTWQWKLENMPQGLRVDDQGRYAALAVSKRSQNSNESLHGVSVFDLTTEGGGLKKYQYTYRTEGQLPYDTLAISADGLLIAIVEMPIVMPDATVRGKNRVHVLY